MSTRLLSRSLRYVLAAMTLAGGLLALASHSLTTARATGRIYVVNSPADMPAADVGNPACSDANNHCTRRAAPTAPTFTVNSTFDLLASMPLDNGVCETAPGNGMCTLRAAIMKANHYPGSGATIRFGLPGTVTYTLTIPPAGFDDERTGDLNITNTMTIIGNGAGNTIIDGNSYDRVFRVGNGITATISGVTIKNGFVSTCGAGGGGIQNNGTLTLVNSTVSGNTTYCLGGSYGGGITNWTNAVLTVTTSTVSGNTATGSLTRGGGIYTQGPLTVLNSTVSGNGSDDDGGGIYPAGPLMLVNSTVSGNRSTNGGGLYFLATSGTISNSTINGNLASNGGGIFNYLNTLVIINSTVSSNNSTINGGGIYNDSGTTSLYNVTITGNLANDRSSGSGFGGGVEIVSGTVNFQNSIIAGNNNIIVIAGHSILNPEDCSGTITSQGNNIMHATIDCTISGGGVTVANPMLGPLANNGGPTQTHAPLTGSPAIDHGDDATCPTIDQRGFHRPIGLHCDIGATEVGPYVYLPLIRR